MSTFSAFEESADWALLSSFCNDSKLAHICVQVTLYK